MKVTLQNGTVVECSAEEYVVAFKNQTTTATTRFMEVEVKKPKTMAEPIKEGPRFSRNVRNGRIIWTDEEVSLLMNNKDKSDSELKRLFPKRTLPAIRVKLYKLGELSRKDLWKKEEENILKNNKEKTIEKLMELLPNRSEKAIKVKLYKIFGKGVGTDTDKRTWTKEEDRILKEHKDEDPQEIQQRYFPHRSVSSVRTRIWLKYVRPNKKSSHIGWSKEEDQIIIDNPKMGGKDLALKIKGRSASAIGVRKHLLKKKGLLSLSSISAQQSTPISRVEVKKEFPHFDMIAENGQSFIVDAVRHMVGHEKRMEMSDILWIPVKDEQRWTPLVWEQFVSQFIADSLKIKSFLNLTGTFVVEGGRFRDKIIVYRGA